MASTTVQFVAKGEEQTAALTFSSSEHALAGESCSDTRDKRLMLVRRTDEGRTFICRWQLSQGETATPIFTPDEGYNWKIAKACFEASDFM